MFENVKAFINMGEHFSHELLDKDTKLIQSTFILSLDQKLTVDGPPWIPRQFKGGIYQTSNITTSTH